MKQTRNVAMALRNEVKQLRFHTIHDCRRFIEDMRTVIDRNGYITFHQLEQMAGFKSGESPHVKNIFGWEELRLVAPTRLKDRNLDEWFIDMPVPVNLEEVRMMYSNLKPGDEVKVKDYCNYFTWSDTWNGYPMHAPTKVEFVKEYDRFVELHCWFTNTFFGNDADYVTSVDKWRLRTKQVTIEPIGEAA